MRSGAGRVLGVVVLASIGLLACTSDRADDAAASACADGDEPLAYVDVGAFEGAAEVWVDPRSGEPHKVTGGDGWAATRPAFSPDGQQLAVTRSEGDYESAGPTSTDIWTVRADGSNLQKVTGAEISDYFDDAAWSPNGNDMAVSYLDAGTRSGGIQIISTEGDKKAEALTETPPATMDLAPAWSPSGDEVAYLRAQQSPDPQVEMRVRNLDDDGDRLIATVNDNVDTVDWSPTASTLLISRGGGHAYTVDIDSGSVTDVGEASFARWASDGSRIYFIDSAGQLAEGSIDEGVVTVDSTIEGSTWSNVYPYLGLGVARCSTTGT